MQIDDPFALSRFTTAHEGDFERACKELREGKKRTHWMWYIFPQLKGLGISATSEFYGISSLEEARAYLAHPVLGPRLTQATEIVLDFKDRSLNEIFGSPDDMKFCSSMALFAEASAPGNVFNKALEQFCGGIADERTLALLRT